MEELSQTIESLETRLAALSARLKGAREAIANGQRIELVALDAEINELCIMVAEGRPDTRRFLPDLTKLIDELNALEADLTRQYEMR